MLVRDGAAEGYGEYRAHVDFMDLIAEQYDFNDGAMGRFNARIKGALDPQGILSPGKQGIWPAEARGPSRRATGRPRRSACTGHGPRRPAPALASSSPGSSVTRPRGG